MIRLRLDQDIGEDRKRLTSFDDTTDLKQGFEQILSRSRDFHAEDSGHLLILTMCIKTQIKSISPAHFRDNSIIGRIFRELAFFLEAKTSVP
jgi:hypothetical protein